MLKIFGGLFAARHRGVEDGAATLSAHRVSKNIQTTITCQKHTRYLDGRTIAPLNGLIRYFSPVVRLAIIRATSGVSTCSNEIVAL